MNEKKEVLLIAHRGASRLAPENTLKAFQKAIDLKADYVEFDVHGTKDGEIVIMHDDDTSRTTGQKGKIKEMTLEELKVLDCGEGEKIPTLQELIDIAKGKIGLQLEIKAPGLAPKIADLLTKADLIESTIISSFDHNELLEVQKIKPKIKLSALVLGIKKKKTIKEAVKNHYYAIHPLYKFVNRKFLESAHENNIKVNTWTVDSPSGIRKLVDMGIDGIITNDIITAKKILNR
ncbi:MAG: glycerophosphodiester phosphodiesterase [Promethearchaeota archaeon]